jgi:hypothetical protein
MRASKLDDHQSGREINAIVKVVMEMTVMDEMVVIVAVPTITPTIPGVLTGASMPCRTKTSACNMSSVPATTGKARFALLPT